jgi:hypothetical protein
MKSPSRSLLLRLTLLICLALTAGSYQSFSIQGLESGTYLGNYSWQWMLVLGAVALLGVFFLIALVLSWTRVQKPLFIWANNLQKVLNRSGWWVWLGFFLIIGLLSLAVFTRLKDHLYDQYPRMWLFWFSALLGAALLQSRYRRLSYFHALLATILIYAVIFRTAAFRADISRYPLSLGWSEGSRYYYASIFFSKSLYGVQLPLPVLHPTRYLMQSLAYLIPGATIVVHRIWQVFLWVAATGLTAILIARRLKINSRPLAVLFVLWAYLFIFQGPVYYHVILCTVPVLWGFDRRHFWHNLLLVVLGSVWAGVSRINWFPVPGLLATLLYLIEERMEGRPLWRYLLPPAVWTGAGVAIAFAVERGYRIISGNPPEFFGSALNSPLIWSRLLPNPTYPLGILFGSLLVILPVLFLCLRAIFQNSGQWHFIRLLGIGGILLAFLGGGWVVSSKIGGGSNLHNLDAFLVLFLMASGAILFRRFAQDSGDGVQWFRPAWWILALIVVMPASQIFQAGQPIGPAATVTTTENLAKLNNAIARLPAGSKVLFITERQLIPMKLVPQVDFEPEYEKVFLMEMAMADNRAYLDRFEDDLRNHRFALIVSEPIRAKIQDTDVDSFADENNVWVKSVDIPLLKYYEVKDEFDQEPVVLLAPKAIQ